MINAERVYHNYDGKLPPITLAKTAVEPPSTTERKLITDTTLRDGAQDSRFALFPVEARLKYIELLNRLDNGTGTIDRLEMFIYQERDAFTLHESLKRGYTYPEITTWTRATPKDIKLLMDVSNGQIKETGMLASSSDHHIFDKLRFASKEEAAEKYLQPVVTAYENGIRPRLHLEDTTRADIFGWVIPFIQMALKATNGTARFRVCDTIGWGSPDPYAALPWGIPRLISTLKAETGAELEYHGHNDFGLATANTMAAWRYGATKANVTFAGLGERTGNTALEQMVAAYIRLYGDPGLDLTALDDMRQLITAEVLPTNTDAPIIGEVFTTVAGIHQSGVSRQEHAPGGLIYLPFAATLFGREEIELSRIGGLSGADGIVSALNRQVEIETGVRGTFTTTSRVVKQVYDAVQAAYDGTISAEGVSGERREFFSAAELLALARRYDPQLVAAE